MRFRFLPWFSFLLCSAWSGATGLAALGDRPLLTEVTVPGAFPLVRGGDVTTLHVADGDWSGVRRAAGDLQADIERVTGRKPELLTTAPGTAPAVVLIGTLGKSALIDNLVAAGKLDVAAIRN